MKRSIFLWCFGGFTFSAVLGTALHFVYSFTNLTAFTPISAVNESTWEHMKILFFPMLFFAIFEWFFFKDYHGFWWVKLIGTVTSVLSIAILFYTIGGAFGKTPDYINILIFFVSAGLGYLIEGLLLKSNFFLPLNFIPIIILIIITILFIIFTYFPPKIPLFLDPLTNNYGLVYKNAL